MNSSATATLVPARPAGPGAPRRVEVTAYGGADGLRVSPAPPPARLAPGEARIQVLASSLSLSDSIVRRGLSPYTSGLDLPFPLGYDIVGRVTELERPAAHLGVGDLVADLLRWGGNVDLLTRPSASLTRVAGGLDPVQVEPLVMNGVTAYQVLHRVAEVRPGQRVLVHGGTGGVGLLLVELAVIAGAEVVATGSPGKHGALTGRGATALDGRSPDLAERLVTLVPDGFDVIADGVGGVSRREVAGALRPGGILVGFGFAGPAGQVTGRTPQNRRHTATVLAQGRAVLDEVVGRGSRAVEYDVSAAREADRPAYDADLNALVALVSAGRLRPEVRAVGLDDVRAAYAELERGRVTGRLVLDHRTGASVDSAAATAETQA